MKVKTKILIVEHNPDDIELMLYELKKGELNFVSHIVQNEQDYAIALKDFIPDIILSDYSLPSFDGPTAFKMREEMTPDTPFIFVSGTIGEENSIELIKSGVTDYALKDKLFTLPTKIRRALKEAAEKRKKNKAEQELIQNERRLARAQELAHMGSWELDFVTNKVLWSDEACRIYGLPPDKNEQSFETWLSFTHPEDLARISKIVKESQDSLSNFSFHYRIVHNSGEIRHIYSECKIEFNSEGKPTGMYGIAHDETDNKLAELELAKITNDLVQRNKDLEQFAYIVSHNLRAPVANIQGAMDVLNYPELNPEEKEILNAGIKESVAKLDAIVKDLNRTLQVKRESIEIKEPVLFSELVHDIKISIKNVIDADNIEVKCDFVAIDEFLTLKSYLHSIFYNLITNSIKYRKAETPCVIEIKSRKENNKIELNFTDNGMGIDLEKNGDDVFGLYKRFHTHIDGKGMGLFMVKTQVETLGGKISVKSEVDKGTEFKIVFEN